MPTKHLLMGLLRTASAVLAMTTLQRILALVRLGATLTALVFTLSRTRGRVFLFLPLFIIAAAVISGVETLTLKYNPPAGTYQPSRRAFAVLTLFNGGCGNGLKALKYLFAF